MLAAVLCLENYVEVARELRRGVEVDDLLQLDAAGAALRHFGLIGARIGSQQASTSSDGARVSGRAAAAFPRSYSLADPVVSRCGASVRTIEKSPGEGNVRRWQSRRGFPIDSSARGGRLPSNRGADAANPPRAFCSHYPSARNGTLCRDVRRR